MNKLNTIGNGKMEDNEEISFEHHFCSYYNLFNCSVQLLSRVWLLISQTYLIVHLCNLIPKDSHV